MYESQSKITLLAVIRSRLMEASTYAGLSALCLVIVTGFSQSDITRDMALCGAVAAAVGAIARSENNIKLARELDQATQLIPILTKTAVSIERIYSEDIKPQP